MMKTFAPIFLVSLIFGCAAQPPDTIAPVDLRLYSVHVSGSEAPSVLARLRYFKSEHAPYYSMDSYQIDVRTPTLTCHAARGTDDAVADFDRRWREGKKHDAEVYAQIADRFDKSRNELNASSDLAKAMEWTQKSRAGGLSPQAYVLASPDGAYAVFAAPYSAPVILTEVATLATRRVSLFNQSNLILSNTPVAWSADSRYLAFAPPGDGKLYIYDVQRHSIISTKPPSGGEIGAISWSPDGAQIAVFALHNRRMSLDPLSLLVAFSGHPNFFNDGILHIYQRTDDQPRSVLLKRAISEIGSPDVRLDWGG